MSVMLDAIYCKSIACWEPTAGNRAHPASTSMAVCCGKISSPLSYALISNPTVACSSHAAPTSSNSQLNQAFIRTKFSQPTALLTVWWLLIQSQKRHPFALLRRGGSQGPSEHSASPSPGYCHATNRPRFADLPHSLLSVRQTYAEDRASGNRGCQPPESLHLLRWRKKELESDGLHLV